MHIGCLKTNIFTSVFNISVKNIIDNHKHRLITTTLCGYSFLFDIIVLQHQGFLPHLFQNEIVAGRRLQEFEAWET